MVLDNAGGAVEHGDPARRRPCRPSRRGCPAASAIFSWGIEMQRRESIVPIRAAAESEQRSRRVRDDAPAAGSTPRAECLPAAASLDCGRGRKRLERDPHLFEQANRLVAGREERRDLREHHVADDARPPRPRDDADPALKANPLELCEPSPTTPARSVTVRATRTLIPRHLARDVTALSGSGGKHVRTGVRGSAAESVWERNPSRTRPRTIRSTVLQ